MINPRRISAAIRAGAESGIGSALVSAGCLAMLAWAMAAAAPARAGFFIASIGTYAAGAVCALVLGGSQRRRGPFGRANRITLLRWALAALLFGMFWQTVTTAWHWLVIGLAVANLLLDGLDGRLARHYRESSEFGARFDMETDAAVILVLAGLVWYAGAADAWVLIGGLLRYLFVAAGLWWSWLRVPLPPSRRRQTICVVQIVSLLVCLAPFVPHSLAPLIAFLGVTLLVASFLIDVRWLAMRRHASDRLLAA